MKKRLKAGLATAGLVAAAGVVGASPSAADTCWNTRDVSIGGGQSHYTISCDTYGYVTVAGWLKDTKADGKCIQVKAIANDRTYYSNKACPKGEVEYFEWTKYVPSSQVYVYTFSVG